MIEWPEQEQIFKRRVNRSYWRMMIFLLLQKKRVKRESYRRYQLGYWTFGDNMFHRNEAQLFEEKVEEGADLLAYQIADDERGRRV